MKKYKTFQEAMIENPDYFIFKSSDFFYAVKGDSVAVSAEQGLILCNYEDYCVTVEDFLNNGHLVECGDLVIDSARCVWELVDCDGVGIVNGFTARKAKNSYILRAAALEKPPLQTGEDFEHTKTLNFIRDRLVEVYGVNASYDYMHKLNNAIAFVERMEDVKKNCGGIEPKVLRGAVEIEKEKPKRTKVEYVKVELSMGELASLMIDGEVFYGEDKSTKYRWLDCGFKKDESWTPWLSHNESYYRRVETEITEREEFIDEAKKLTSDFTKQSKTSGFFEFMFNSGKFKLVN